MFTTRSTALNAIFPGSLAEIIFIYRIMQLLADLPPV